MLDLRRRRTLLLTFCALAACGTSPTQRCIEEARVLCAKIYECVPESARMVGNFNLLYGSDVEGCSSRQVAYGQCYSKKKDDDLCVGTSAGKKFNGAAFDVCLQKIKALSCTEVMGGTTSPTECGSVCT